MCTDDLSGACEQFWLYAIIAIHDATSGLYGSQWKLNPSVLGENSAPNH